ncbi:alpha/beta hydrolase [Maritalea sp.]|jgi:enterochelin esterase-like enzyme|uniref:alpha/beta hydrolase n=1 Tax=Maritalea sp. TaxID=2003361 RepID=UPI0039E215CF
MRRDYSLPQGTIHRVQVQSEALKSNMLGDHTLRDVDVYVPHGHDGTDLPVIVDLAGYTGSGLGRTGWKGFDENLPARLDRLISSREMRPAVMVFPDCFTRLGGNQYINSVAMGNWADFLIKEMLPQIEGQFSCGGAGKRGVIGKSSGGYAAMIHAMLYADTWSAIACHSGDMGFDVAYLPDMPKALRAVAQHDNSIEKFVRFVDEKHNPSHGDIHALMILAMGATYDPDPNGFCGIRLPVDMHTCELDQTRWDQWLKWDPLHIFDQHVDALKSLKGIWLDCGDVDQFNFVYVARRMQNKLKSAGVDHVYEEFPDDHFSIDYRYDRSLPFLADKLC